METGGQKNLWSCALPNTEETDQQGAAHAANTPVGWPPLTGVAQLWMGREALPGLAGPAVPWVCQAASTSRRHYAQTQSVTGSPITDKLNLRLKRREMCASRQLKQESRATASVIHPQAQSSLSAQEAALATCY